jgi:hypothetical protein
MRWCEPKAAWLLATALVLASPALAQVPPYAIIVKPGAPRAFVVNMTPRELSGEAKRDSEPNLAVNAANAHQIVATALTANPWGGAFAPIYVSTDGGLNWVLNASIPFNHADTGTGDITTQFGSSSSILYTSALRKDFDATYKYALRILRSGSYTSTTPMEVLVQVNDAEADQPWVQAISVPSGVGSVDRVYVGFSPPNGRAMIYRSLDAATAPAPAGFEQIQVGWRSSACARDGPARPAVHSSGTIYAAFFRFRDCTTAPWQSDVVVVRDDNWAATAGGAFSALLDPSDGQRGKLVATNVMIPYNQMLGNQRLGSQISIAVDPTDSRKLYLAWGSGTLAQYAIRLRKSTDGGATWSGDLRVVEQATNPSLAINSWGKVAFLYQKLLSASPPIWETRLERSSDGFETTPASLLLHSADYSLFPSGGAGPLGDYNDLVAAGRSFYGVFSANNTPDMANFPQGVRYQRNADFTAKTLLAPDNATVVSPSIDPFFFAVHEPILEICRVRPWLCSNVLMERGGLKLNCLVHGCVVIDPLPRNCLVKFNCPGCAPGGICPPYYHLHLEALQAHWNLTLVDPEGYPVEHQLFRSRTRAVVSFQPSKEKYIDGQIGNYLLVFEMGPGGKVGAEHRVKARLIVSDGHYQPKPNAGKGR